MNQISLLFFLFIPPSLELLTADSSSKKMCALGT